MNKINRNRCGWSFSGVAAVLCIGALLMPVSQPFTAIIACMAVVCLSVGILLSAPDGWVEL
jgi:hypothetical protein